MRSRTTFFFVTTLALFGWSCADVRGQTQEEHIERLHLGRLRKFHEDSAKLDEQGRVIGGAGNELEVRYQSGETAIISFRHDGKTLYLNFATEEHAERKVFTVEKKEDATLWKATQIFPRSVSDSLNPVYVPVRFSPSQGELAEFWLVIQTDNRLNLCGVRSPIEGSRYFGQRANYDNLRDGK
ncbi:MAG: hypothetical protein QM811_10910 [Pirellulales bacterium]